jgi:ribonuclease P protein component
MIDRTHRFHGRSSLRFAYQRGRNIRNPFATLRYALNGRRSTYRLAVVVSRKVSKSAVVRNRIRRRIYEVIRQLQYGITEPYDLIFNVYSDTLATMEHDELLNLLKSQLKEAAVFQDDRNNGGVHGIVNAKERQG